MKGDPRYKKAFNVNSYRTNRNVSSSFNTGCMECATCPVKHPVLYKEIDGVDQTNMSPQCFNISDQNFPAFLPSLGEGECVKIVRIEDASLDELVTYFLETIRGFAVPAGSVVMLHSASHLAWVGAAAYAEDLIAAQSRIDAAFGNSIVTLHGIPLLGSGTEEPGLIKSLVTIGRWYDIMMMDTIRDIHLTRNCWLDMLLPGTPMAPGGQSGSGSLIASDPSQLRGSPMAPRIVVAAGSPMAPVASGSTAGSSMTSASAAGGAGSPMAPAARYSNVDGSGSAMPPGPSVCAGSGSPMASLSGMERLRMPGDLSGKSSIIVDAGNVSFATRLEPVSEEAEKGIVLQLLRELNEVFALDLDLDADTWRGRDSEQSMISEPVIKKRRIFVVGASHAKKLADELTELGEHVVCLATPTWRISDNSETTSAELKKQVNTPWPGDTVVVYQIYDSSIYFASSGPGEMSLPRRGREDGRYHVEGVLKMADRETFKQIVYGSVPLLRAGGEGVKIVVAPMPRYITAPCCSNKKHVTNFGERKYGKQMGDRLADIGEWVKEFVYGKRINNFQVFCPTSLTMCPDDTKEEMRAIWGRDPVHLSRHGYAKEARALVDILNKSLNLERTSKAVGQQTSDRPRRDWSENRQPWVSRSDATATRDYGSLPGRSAQNWRGGNTYAERNRGGFVDSRNWRRGGHHGPRGRLY